MQQNRESPARTQLLRDARTAAQVAHAVAGPALASALGYLQLMSDNGLLPDELRAKAREAALRVAEAAVHLECLPDVIEFSELEPLASVGFGGAPPSPPPAPTGRGGF